MATYTYKCENEECEVYDLAFDVEMSMTDDNLTQCPECAEQSLKKVIESTGGGFRIGGAGVHKPTAHWGN